MHVKLCGGKFRSYYSKKDSELNFHCWNEFGPWLIDITATQFISNLIDIKPIIYLKTEEAYRKGGPYVFSSYYDNGYRSFVGWMSDNKPNPELIAGLLK